MVGIPIEKLDIPPTLAPNPCSLSHPDLVYVVDFITYCKSGPVPAIPEPWGATPGLNRKDLSTRDSGMVLIRMCDRLVLVCVWTISDALGISVIKDIIEAFSPIRSQVQCVSTL